MSTRPNTGTLNIGSNSLFAPDSVAANFFDNSGTVDLIGDGTNFAALDVLGAATNNGSILIASDTEELAGAIVGVGSINLKNANLQFDSSVSSGQTINEPGADLRFLPSSRRSPSPQRSPVSWTGDTIDATNPHAPPATTLNFVGEFGDDGRARSRFRHESEVSPPISR